MALDPNVTLPYWNHLNCFAHPELDKVFDLFGHGGDPNNSYCVTDGAFANVTVSFFLFNGKLKKALNLKFFLITIGRISCFLPTLSTGSL